MSERSLGYALLDNVIGFDDDYRTAGERLGSAIKDNPRAVAKSVVDGVTGSIGDFATRVREEGPASALTGSLQDYSESILGAGLNLSSGTQGYMDRGMTQAEARDAQLGDAMLVSELIPLVGGAGLAARSAKSVVPEAPSDPSRRDFMAKGAAAAGVAAIMPEELLKQAGKVLNKAPKGSLGGLLNSMDDFADVQSEIYRKIGQLRQKIKGKTTEESLINRSERNPKLKNILLDEKTSLEIEETRPIVEEINRLKQEADNGNFQQGTFLRQTVEDLTPEQIKAAKNDEIEELFSHIESGDNFGARETLFETEAYEGLIEEARQRGMHTELHEGMNTKDHGSDAGKYPTTMDIINLLDGGYAEGGEVMNRMQQGIASIPRQTMIRDQPHMLAYITPAEAMLLKQNGGSGLPSHGGVPEFGAIGDFFSSMASDFAVGTGMKEDPGQKYNIHGAETPYEKRHRENLARQDEAAKYDALYKEDDKPQPVQFVQPMYQAPAPVNVAPPTLDPISSGQPTVPPLNDQTATNVTNPSDVIARPPAMPIGQRPPNKAYTFQELLGMYQNPYA
jgi:hypothetical protein